MRKGLILTFLCIFAIFSAHGSILSENKDLPEIHLVVDVSGSMKKTDPDRLRLKAFQLLYEMGINKANISLIAFSTSPEILIPSQQLNQQFMKKYKQIEPKISNANGHWTNINDALVLANQNWHSAKKIIVLLSDGQLDLGSDEQNIQSKDMISNYTLPMLLKNGVKVFSIGLSDNADMNLLTKLSNETEGIAWRVLSAQNLDDAMYSIFTSAIPAQGTAIHTEDGNGVINVDGSIQNLMIIYNKNTDDKSLTLVNPEGNIVDYRKPNKNIQSMSISKFSLIKIENPKAGKWMIKGQNNEELKRAIIVSDLKLLSSFESGKYYKGEVIPFKVKLTGTKLKQNINKLYADLNVSVVLKNGESSVNSALYYNSAQGDFSGNLILKDEPGTYNVEISAEGPLLSRESQYFINVLNVPFQYALDENGQLNISLNQDAYIQPNSVDIKLLQNGNMAEVKQQNNTHWAIDLMNACSLGNSWKFDISAKTDSGRMVKFTFPNLLVTCPVKKEILKPEPVAQPVPVVAKIEPQPVVKPVVQPKPQESLPVAQPQKAPPQESHNAHWGLYLLITLILAAITAVAWISIKFSRKLNKMKGLS